MTALFQLRIDCKTAAFGDNPENAIAGILDGIANTLRHIGTAYPEYPRIATPILDVNGITCGVWTLEGTPAQVNQEAEKNHD